ncbi:heme-binding protein [Burkholderia alba]
MVVEGETVGAIGASGMQSGQDEAVVRAAIAVPMG